MKEINSNTMRLIEHRLRRTSETCPKHPKCHLVYLEGFDKVEPFCEACQLEKNEEQKRLMVKQVKEQDTRGYLRRQSLVDRNEVFNYTFDNFIVPPAKEQGQKPLEAIAKRQARKIAGAYFKYPHTKGNSLLYGNAGAGKTHLAMAILNAVNDNSEPMQRCLFLSFNKLIRKMKDWFNDKAGVWSPKHVTDVVKKANLVVLDDLGAESANNMATSFVQDTIFDIYESNQRIITTTNLSVDELYRTYHQRLVSRMQEGDRSRVIDFTKIADKRTRI